MNGVKKHQKNWILTMRLVNIKSIVKLIFTSDGTFFKWTNDALLHSLANMQKVSRNLGCKTEHNGNIPVNHVDVLLPEVIQVACSSFSFYFGVTHRKLT